MGMDFVFVHSYREVIIGYLHCWVVQKVQL